MRSKTHDFNRKTVRELNTLGDTGTIERTINCRH